MAGSPSRASHARTHAHMLATHRPASCAAFGLPNRRKRVFMVASYYGDARGVLLSQASSSAAQRSMHGTPHHIAA